MAPAETLERQDGPAKLGLADGSELTGRVRAFAPADSEMNFEEEIEPGAPPTPRRVMSDSIAYVAFLREGAESELVREAARYRAMSLEEILAEWARLAEARHGPPHVPEWAVALDSEDRKNCRRETG